MAVGPTASLAAPSGALNWPTRRCLVYRHVDEPRPATHMRRLEPVPRYFGRRAHPVRLRTSPMTSEFHARLNRLSGRREKFRGYSEFVSRAILDPAKRDELFLGTSESTMRLLVIRKPSREGLLP